MRRACWNWHGRAVGTLLFMVVFLAATLSGSPRNHDRRIGSQRKSVYSRTLAENDQYANNGDEDVAKEVEDSDFAEKPREFHAEPIKTNHEVSVLQKPNATSCAVVLLKKHPELCDVVEEILQIQALLPQLRRVVARRMGGRRFNFVYEMVRGKTAFQHLYETVKCMAVCIKKFVKFVGTVEGLIIKTTTTEAPVLDVEIIEDSHHASYDWYLTSMKKDPPKPSFTAPHFNPSSSRYSSGRRGSPRNCVASVMKVDPDVCGTLAKMELLDSILVTPEKAISAEDPIENSELPVELDSENLVLGKLLDAVEESLADARTNDPDVGTTEEARRHWDTRDKTRSRGRRRMPNENDEEATEIFQTPDFKIELVPHDDHRNFGDTDESRTAKNFMVDRNKEYQGRRVFTAEDRSVGLHGEKANGRGQDMTKGPLSTRAQSLLRNVTSERDRSAPWSTHSSRSLSENSTSGNTAKGKDEIQKLLQSIRESWDLPYYPDRTIPRKKYPHYRAGDPDTERSKDEKNKEPCEEKEAEQGNWKEWLFSKVREFSKAFGA